MKKEASSTNPRKRSSSAPSTQPSPPLAEAPDRPHFGQDGLVPAVVSDPATGQVLMMAWMNEEAWSLTLSTGRAHFWSRSRSELWEKGASSGNTMRVTRVRIDCDADTVLLDVIPAGPACHTGSVTCFFNDVPVAGSSDAPDPEAKPGPWILERVRAVIDDRRRTPTERSYTAYLFDKGTDKILKKLGEESAEVIIAAKNGDRSNLVGESCDLVYHLMVLLAQQGVPLDDLWAELLRRHQ